MRNFEEVINLILEFASNDNRIRLVMLNGSRVNSKAPVDIMQDYDIVFFIDDLFNSSYKQNRYWINKLGKLVILQQNDFKDGSYIFLMQFTDIRIDLRFCDINNANEVVKEDTLSKILLDKDNILEQLPPPNDKTHWVKKPTKKEWDNLLNEAWWIQTYIAKGIWRDELSYVKYMYDVILIECVRKLLSWHIGLKYEWSINVGKCGKWFKILLESEMYERYVSLYPSAEYEDIWNRLFNTGLFIREIGVELGEKLGYEYPLNDDVNVTEYLKRLKKLPKDATEIN